MDAALIAGYKVDRSGWPTGEWDDEPDRVDFHHAGLACLLLRNRLGAWCGYVGVPSTHPAYAKPYDAVDVDVHGGLTYGSRCDGHHICHVPQPGEPDDLWWLGFDCMHHMDVIPSMPETRGWESDYRSVRYVRRQTEDLAEQLAAMMTV